jgi:predicted NBD/HSP70 family sugar kinase
MPVVLKRYAALSGTTLAQNDFLTAALAGDPHALAAMKEAAAMHGWAIAQMVQLIDPEMVVLAGPLTALGDVYLEAVNKVTAQFASAYHPAVTVLISELGEFAGAVGAAALALERWRPDSLS